jgi:hypothetical protein
MWGALLAASIAGWLHQLTATHRDEHNSPEHDAERYPRTPEPLAGLGIRDGKAMIATLRHRLLCIPGRLIHHAGQLILRLPPATTCSPRSSPDYAPSPTHPDHATPGPDHLPEPATRGDTRARSMPTHRKNPTQRSTKPAKINSTRYSRNRVRVDWTRCRPRARRFLGADQRIDHLGVGVQYDQRTKPGQIAEDQR